MEYYCDNFRHLICVPYSIEGLHEMAKELGIKRCWFHKGRNPHYDIPKSRLDEIMDKCTIVDTEDLLLLIWAYTK